MNPYKAALERLQDMYGFDLDALVELKQSKGARDSARDRSGKQDEAVALPYVSRPEFIGERWNFG